MRRIAIIASALLVCVVEAFSEKSDADRQYSYSFKYSDVISDNISMAPIDRIIKDWGILKPECK
ncbi:hypothetical protein [Pontiella sulfatireligans]|uniref:hypothetical protein n=1 Tax=Pontiella sulfatireligans TaxID=2750658 RepID=UPI00109CEC7F|nr:hypothetical protein [Pontiella sulfatireligans]